MMSLTDFLTECTINKDAEKELIDLLCTSINTSIYIRSRITPQGKFIFSPVDLNGELISPNELHTTYIEEHFIYHSQFPTSWSVLKNVKKVTMDEANTIASLIVSLGAYALLNLHPAFAEIHAKEVDFAVELYREKSPSDYVFDVSIRNCCELYAYDELLKIRDHNLYFVEYFPKMLEHYKRYGYNFMTSKMWGEVNQVTIRYGW